MEKVDTQKAVNVGDRTSSVEKERGANGGNVAFSLLEKRNGRTTLCV